MLTECVEWFGGGLSAAQTRQNVTRGPFQAARAAIRRFFNAASARNMFQPAQRSNTAIPTQGEPRVRSRPIPALRFSPLLTDSPPARIR